MIQALMFGVRQTTSDISGSGASPTIVRPGPARYAAASHPTQQKVIERRKYIRFSTPMELEYRTLTLNPIFGKTLARDLSREGIRFSLREKVAVGTVLEISLNVPGDNLPVFAKGRVAWADGLEAGIKLTKISQTDRARVLEHVYNEWLKKNKHKHKKN